MSAKIPRITLNSGVELPALGLGVFQNPPAETAGAVEAAIATGYRLIDTAAAYLNEREVGEGIRRAGLRRDQVFIETKLWISDYGYDAALHAFERALASSASTSSTCCCSISRCRRHSIALSKRTGRSRSFSRTARCAPSA